jgi:myosin-crossreactive antigen
MVLVLSLLCLLQFVAIVFVVYHSLRWARVIFLLEDDLSEAVDIHERTVAVFEGLLKMEVFFDSPAVKAQFDAALEDVKVCQTATQKLIQSFTQRSKQRYVRLVTEDNKEEEE